jgi:hypothetical protein
MGPDVTATKKNRGKSYDIIFQEVIEFATTNAGIIFFLSGQNL